MYRAIINDSVCSLHTGEAIKYRSQECKVQNPTIMDSNRYSAYILAVLLWENHLTFLSFSFLTCKMEDSTVHQLHRVVEELNSALHFS